MARSTTAAGEAFDKVGKLLGLPYPGGPEIDRLAGGGDPARFDLPRSMLGSGDFAFSFSGLKTAVRYLLPKLALDTLLEAERGQTLADVCASFQAAVVEVLVQKTLRGGAGNAARPGGRERRREPEHRLARCLCPCLRGAGVSGCCWRRPRCVRTTPR